MALGRELPDDLVADVLRHLPPRSLAVSRCACRAWRDLIDDRRLLRADLLPHTVGGIFMNYCLLYSSEFLARPTTGPSISGNLEFIPGGSPKVTDHCNGLVLCTGYSGNHDYDYVANPATRQWARLPPPPPLPLEPADSEMGKKSFVMDQIKCLVYDPIMSQHYDVFLIHFLNRDQLKMQCEGPLSSHPLQVYVYSSETRRWEERWFDPEGHVVETTMAVDDEKPKVYWRGALYLLCENNFVMRISISNAKYTLIPTPTDVQFVRYLAAGFSLGRSEKGVYCAFEHDFHGVQIFSLNESCGQMVWELRHSVDLESFARKLHARGPHGDQPNGPWILEDVNCYKYPSGNDMHTEGVEANMEWNSDDDDVLSTKDLVEGRYAGYTGLLGFHPYKEIVFLDAALSRAVAYHWNTSKFQDLGNICPTYYHFQAGHVASIDTSFIYTPCWMEDLPQNSLEAPIEN